MELDAIVVGGGHNGLICAAYLARAGAAVAVLEARPVLGGAPAQDEVGAAVDLHGGDQLAVRSAALIEELDLARHGLRFLDGAPALIALGAGETAPSRPLVLFHDLDRTLDGLARTHPDQVDGYRRFVRTARPAARLALALAEEPPGAFGALRQAARRGGAGAATLLAWGRRSAAEVYEAFLSSPLLLGAGAALGPGVWGLGPHAPRSGLAALGFALRHVAPPARPVGGGGAFSAALRASLEEAGGLVRTSTRVTALLVEGERVVGVATESGDELRAKAVVAACDPRSALLRWLADPPPAAASRLAAWRSWTEPDGCESRLDAVVDRLPGYQRLDRRVVDALAVDPLAATVVFAPSVAEIDLAHRASAKGEIARSPVMLAGLPSVLDRTLRPDKRGHVLSLQVLFTPYALKGGWPGSGEPRRWLGEYAERLEPGFLEGVRAWRATTPDRYEAELGLPRGHAASGVGGPLAALSGQAGELSRYETPIEGLFLSAAATFPGAGSWAASGRNAAHVVLERLEGLGRSRRPRRRTASGASAP